MKKIFLLILITATFSFAQISTIIGVNITVAGTATLKTLTGFNGNNYLQLAAGSGNSLKNNLYINTGFGIVNTTTNASISLQSRQVNISTAGGSYAPYFSVNGNTGTLEQHISSASYETSVLLGEGSLFVTGTNPLFSGIDFVIDNSANWGLHSAVDKSYVDSKVFTGAIMPTTLTAASFGGNSYQTITTTKKVAYIINANTHVITSPTYDNAANPTQVTIDIGVVPTGNVIIGFVQ